MILVVWLLACSPNRSAEPPTKEPLLQLISPKDEVIPAWPQLGSEQGLLAYKPKELVRDRPLKVYLDPGHGAPRNSGNRSATCKWEMFVTLEAAEHLKATLQDLGPYEIRVGRKEGQRTRYQDRVSEANSWGADLFLSLHTDNRKITTKTTWSPKPDQTCDRNDDAPGTTILYSDEGPLGPQRAQLARSIADELRATGFPHYNGEDYPKGMYASDIKPGVFIDRRGKGIYVLRRPTMPSVIIEMFHSWNLEEERRWEQAHTKQAFEYAIHRAIVDYLEQEKKR